jgi:hypothetical protein
VGAAWPSSSVLIDAVVLCGLRGLGRAQARSLMAGVLATLGLSGCVTDFAVASLAESRRARC